MKKLPPLAALRVFEAAARAGSFTLAAHELNVTTGAVSRQVKLLESHLGMALFVRHHRRVELSTAGVHYAAAVKQVFDTLLRAEEGLRHGDKHIVRIDCVPTLAMYWLTPLLEDFRKRSPDTLLTVSTATGPVDTDGAFDIAIRRDTRHFSGLAAQELMAEHSLPVCSAAFARRHNVQTPEKMLRCPTIHVRARDDLWPTWTRQFGLPAPWPSKRLELDHTFAAIQAAEDGLGLVVVPLVFAKRMLDAGRLVAPFPAMVAESGHYYLLRRERDGSDLVTKVCKWLRSRSKQV
jgi:LysR family glycine cleavage system transcriptional activator